MMVGLGPAVRAAAGAECPIGVTFAATAPATLDVGWTRTLTAGSLDGPTGLKCFCGTCNNPNPGNADRPANGANFGIRDAKRCLGGTNAGAARAASSQCPGTGSMGCGSSGDGPRPNACLDDTTTSDPSGGLGWSATFSAPFTKLTPTTLRARAD
jgi:hypothetical protein